MSEPSNYEKIYAVVKRIPKGRVATYGQIAAMAGIPRHARQVGYALRNTPDDLVLPWYRVVNAQGKVSMRSRPGCDDFQYILLADEGIEVGLEGKISLAKYQWNPRYVTKKKPAKRSQKR
jgi:methylated-DNA-protein-cysteine methyltransferase-like protein